VACQCKDKSLVGVAVGVAGVGSSARLQDADGEERLIRNVRTGVDHLREHRRGTYSSTPTELSEQRSAARGKQRRCRTGDGPCAELGEHDDAVRDDGEMYSARAPLRSTHTHCIQRNPHGAFTTTGKETDGCVCQRQKKKKNELCARVLSRSSWPSLRSLSPPSAHRTTLVETLQCEKVRPP
jgi:hypothetical protein